jgi:hypothetical protein
MKTITLSLIALTMTLFVDAQEFMGISVGGPTQECVNKFLAKGFRKVHVEGGLKTVVSLVGMVNNQNLEVNVVSTPNSKKVWKISVYFPEKTTWWGIKSEYNDIRTSLINKYGEPKHDYSFFSSPYYEGDGYEMSAITLEKCTFSSFWETMSIQISRFKQVNVTYENLVNSAINEREVKSLQMNML